VALFGLGRSKTVVPEFSDPPFSETFAGAPLSNPLGLPDFLARLATGDRDRLSAAAVAASAKRLGVPSAVMAAIVEVEAAGREGFGLAGLPAMTFEPAVFSHLTGHRHDNANPDISYPVADARKLPASQELRWKQLAKSYVMDRDAALKAASWGMFVMRGEEHQAYGFETAAAMAASLAGAEARQLEALEEWIVRQDLTGALKKRDWIAYGAAREPAHGKALASRLYKTHRRLTDKKRR
jgi:N-acetylmuramidase